MRVFALSMKQASLLAMYIFFSHLSFCQFGSVKPNPSQFALPAPAIAQGFAPAVDYRGIIIERYQSSQRMIGTYKVSGSSYFFNGPVKANVFTAENGTGYNVMTAYDTYSQNLEIYQGSIDVDKVMIKGIKEVDSFLLKNDKDSTEAGEMFFINAKQVDGKKNFFVQRVYNGKNFSLYKSYKAILEDASTDYTKSDEKVFSIKSEYYYTGTSVAGLKKLKLTKNALKNEFAQKPDIIPLLDAGDLDINAAETLINLFKKLDEKK